MDAEKLVTLGTFSAKAEGAKVAPLAGGLGVYGFTYQEWAAIFAAAYGLALLADFVIRRWIWPLARLGYSRFREAAARRAAEKA